MAFSIARIDVGSGGVAPFPAHTERAEGGRVRQIIGEQRVHLRIDVRASVGDEEGAERAFVAHARRADAAYRCRVVGFALGLDADQTLSEGMRCGQPERASSELATAEPGATQHAALARPCPQWMFLSARRPARVFVAASTNAHSHAAPAAAVATWPAIQLKAASSVGSGTVLRARIVASVQICVNAAASVSTNGRMSTTPSARRGRSESCTVTTAGYVARRLRADADLTRFRPSIGHSVAVDPGARVLVVINGVPGSGKTSLASELSSKTGLPHLSKDGLKEYIARTLPYEPTLSELSRIAGEVLWDLVAAMPSGAIVETWFGPTGRDTVERGSARAGIDPRCVLEIWCEDPWT